MRVHTLGCHPCRMLASFHFSRQFRVEHCIITLLTGSGGHENERRFDALLEPSLYVEIAACLLHVSQIDTPMWTLGQLLEEMHPHWATLCSQLSTWNEERTNLRPRLDANMHKPSGLRVLQSCF